MNNARYFSTLGAPHLWENSTIHNGSSLDSCWPQKPTLQKLPEFFFIKNNWLKTKSFGLEVFFNGFEESLTDPNFFSPKNLRFMAWNSIDAAAFFGQWEITWRSTTWVSFFALGRVGCVAGFLMFSHVFRRTPMALYMLTGAWKIPDNMSFVIILMPG